jgi:hypothetical protein
MRNLACSGSMLQVHARSMPTVDLPEIGRAFPETRNVPLLGTYAFRDRDRLSVVILSRAIDKRDAAGNVTDPANIPVTMKLPFQGADSVTLYRLLGDPRESNVPELMNQATAPMGIERLELAPLDGNSLSVNEENGGVSSGGTSGIGPGSVYIYEFTGLK